MIKTFLKKYSLLFILVFILSINLVFNLNIYTVELAIKHVLFGTPKMQKTSPKFLLSKDNYKAHLKKLTLQNKNSISLQIELDKYDGSAYGSIIDLYGAEGRYLSIGFANQFNTFNRASPKLLQIISKNDSNLESIKALGKPSSDSHHYHLFVVNNNLFAINKTTIFSYLNNNWVSLENTEFLSILKKNNLITNKQYDVLLKNWVCGKKNKPYCETFIDVTGQDVRFGNYYISEKELLFSPKHIKEIQDKYPNYKDANFRPIYYWSNRIVIIFSDAVEKNGKISGIASCLHHKYRKSLKVCNFINFSSSYTYSYAIGGNNNELVVNLSDGKAIRISQENDIKVIRRADGNSFQLYSYINADDNLLFGQYPDGDLLTMIDEEYSIITPRIPVDEYRLTSAPELQSLSIYGLEIYGGLWPWGQIWKTDGLKWLYVGRLFSSPQISKFEPDPYRKFAIKNKLSPIDLLGQRITSIIPFGNDILISTGTKNWSPNYKNFPIPKNLLVEYGKIYSLNKPGNFAYDIGIRTSFTLELILDKDANNTDVLIDGKKVGSLGSYINIRKFDNYTINTGLFGDLRGNASLINNVSTDDLK